MDNEQIIEFFGECVSEKKPNGKFQLLRIYGAYERAQQEIQKNKPLDEKLKDNKRGYTIHRISDDMAIVEYRDRMFNDIDVENWFCPAFNDRISNVVYDSFDKALIALVAFKNDSIQASEYIFKMLDMGDVAKSDD